MRLTEHLSRMYGRLCSQRPGNGWMRSYISRGAQTVDKYSKTASYPYPFGRRSSKTVDDITTEFFWQGDKLVAEHHADRHRSYLYEPDRFRPLALLDGFGPKDIQPFHYQLDHLGTPQPPSTAPGLVLHNELPRSNFPHAAINKPGNEQNG